MRLLNTTTLEFEEFWNEDVPHYAILSHTWGENEVTFDDLRTGHAKKKAGFVKLQGFCALAKAHQFDYAWMDTCCIDKSSSAELSEAINSMYRWYERSTVCYTYLEDVLDDDDVIKEESGFRQSRWFTRGWTLQELIAPSAIYFYSVNWKILGCKLGRFNSRRSMKHRKLPPSQLVPNLSKLLSTITGIAPGVLGRSLKPQDCSAATRMSWAASRQTSRSEDTAYSLMGIFDVNMPLLYGEGGEKAFKRLQQEILRVTQDDTLLMHICYEDDCHHVYHPPLASSPRAFRGLGAVERGEGGPLFNGRNISSQMTPNGLQVQLPLCPCEFEDSFIQSRERAYIAILDCIIPGSNLDRGVIVLSKLQNGSFIRYSNMLMSRLEFDKQEVAVRADFLGVIGKATSIEINHLQLMTIYIVDYGMDDVFPKLFVSHWGLMFQGIEQPPGCSIVLHEETQSHRSRRRFLAKQFKVCFLVDETSSNTFLIILGAHNIIRRRAAHRSVPYYKTSIKGPTQTLEGILQQERNEEMYPDKDPDDIPEQDGFQPSPFSQAPSPQSAALELTGSRRAMVSVSTIRFLEREEHRFKLTITEILD